MGKEHAADFDLFGFPGGLSVFSGARDVYSVLSGHGILGKARVARAASRPGISVAEIDPARYFAGTGDGVASSAAAALVATVGASGWCTLVIRSRSEIQREIQREREREREREICRSNCLGVWVWVWLWGATAEEGEWEISAVHNIPLLVDPEPAPRRLRSCRGPSGSRPSRFSSSTWAYRP